MISVPRFDRIHVHLGALMPYARHPDVPDLDDREFVVLEDDEAFIDALPEIEALMAFRPPAGQWHRASSLRFIQVPGAGVDGLTRHTDLGADVVLCNAGGTHEPEMCEFVIGMLLACTYRVPRIVDQQRARSWITPIMPLTALEGATMCVVGLGTIGTGIARRAKALGMRVVGIRHSGAPVDGIDEVVTPDRRHEVLAGAQAAVVVTPLTDETRGLIGAEEIAALAPGAVVVDVSRGGVTDIDAVVDALTAGHLGGAAVDVFETEPLPADSHLWDVPGLLISPHTAAASADYRRRIAKAFADNLLAFEAGESPPGEVDRALGY